VACKEQGHDLVPELLIRHALTAFVFGEHEHGEEITPILLIFAAFFDDCVDDRVEPSSCPFEAEVVRGGDALGDPDQAPLG
jgi:hypothetical protein